MTCTNHKPGTSTTVCEIPVADHYGDHLGRNESGKIQSWENENDSLAQIAELHGLVAEVDEIQKHLERRMHDSLREQNPAIATEISETLLNLDQQTLSSVTFALIADLVLTKLMLAQATR